MRDREQVDFGFADPLFVEERDELRAGQRFGEELVTEGQDVVGLAEGDVAGCFLA